MNAKLLGVVVAMSAAGIVVGCGDSGSGGSGGATSSTGTGTTTSSSSSSKASSSATGTSTATSSGTGMSCQDMCIAQHQTGYATLSQIVVEHCGCASDANAACHNDCMADAACTDNTPNMGLPMSGSACETCIQMQAAMGQGSTCVTQAAFDNACQMPSGNDCAAFVTCALGC